MVDFKSSYVAQRCFMEAFVFIANLKDGIVKDGLTDAYDRVHMGVCAEKTAREYKISRDQQDQYAIRSYQRSAAAWKVSTY